MMLNYCIPIFNFIWKIMMFIMVSNIEGDSVEWAIIGVGLVALLEHVVLRDEVPSHWMKTHCQESSEGQVGE